MNNKLLVVTAVLLVATFAVTLSASFSDGDPVTGTDNEFDTKDEAKNIPGAIWTNNGHPMYVRETFDFTVGDIAYSYADGGVEVSPWYWSWCPHTCDQGHTETVFSGSEYTGDTILIPAEVTYNGQSYNVVGIGNGAFANATNYTVTFPNSDHFTYIGDSVFHNTQPNMQSITIPASVTHIGKYSFSLNTAPVNGDYSLPVTIPNDSRLEYIGDFAFAYNIAVTELSFPDTLKYIGSQAFSGCTSLSFITIPASVNKIETDTFDDYYKVSENGVENVVFEDGSIFQIQDGVLYDQEYLIRVLDRQADVVVPEGILYIGPDAFNAYTTDIPNSMTILESITFPDSLVSIGKSAFRACQSLESVTIPANVTEIEGGVFSECTGLKTVDIKAQLTKLPNTLFYGCVYLENIELPSTITTIGNSTFSGCSNLKSFDFSNIDSIGESGFSKSGLISFDSATSSMTIGESAFGNCLALESIIIPEGMNIPYGAFAGCVNVNTVLIPSEVTVGEGAFFGVTKAVLIFKGNTAPELDDYSFTNSDGGTSDHSAAKIVIPEDSSGYDTLFPNITSISYPSNLVSDSVIIYVNGSSDIDLSVSSELTLTVEPDSECVNVSFDDSVITITGSSPGNATIVASLSINGVEFLSDSCYVTVESAIATPTVTVSGSSDAYNGQSVTLRTEVDGVPAGATPTYKWYNGTVQITGEIGQTMTVSQSGNYSVEVTVTTAAGQTATATSKAFTVTFHDWVVERMMTLCPNFTTFVYIFDYPVEVTGINYTNENDGSDKVVAINGNEIEYVGPGTAHLTIKVEGLQAVSLTIVVESPIVTPTVTVSGSSDAYEGQSVTLTANVSGTYDSTTYQWYNGTTQIQGETGQTLTVRESGDYSVEVTVKTIAGQTAVAKSDKFTVTFREVVATVDGTYYPSIEEALEAADNGSEIVLKTDLTDPVSVPSGTYAMNLNSHSVTGTVTLAGSLTLTGEGSVSSVVLSSKSATLAVDGPTVTSVTDSLSNYRVFSYTADGVTTYRLIWIPSGGGTTPPSPPVEPEPDPEPDVEEHPDGSTTETTTETVTNPDGSKTDTTTVVEKDPQGNVTGSTVTETTTSEKEEDGVKETVTSTTVTTNDSEGNRTGSTSSSTTTTVTDTTTTVVEKEEVRDAEDNVTSSSEKVTETVLIEGGTVTSETTEVRDQQGNVTSSSETATAESDDGNVRTEAITETGSTTVSTVIAVPSSGQVDDSLIQQAVAQSDAVSEMVSAETPGRIIQIDTGSDGDVTFSPASMSAIAGIGAEFRVISGTGSINLDRDVVSTLTEPGEDVTVRMAESEDSELTEAQQAAKGDRFGVTVTATVGIDEVHILGGTATIVIPYDASMGSDPSALGVFYIDEDGVRTFMESVFDQSLRSFIFQTGHFSLYVIDVLQSDEPSDEPSDVPSDTVPEDDDRTLLYAGIAVVVIVIVAIAAVVLHRRY